jgi:intein/homing endonuclease
LGKISVLFFTPHVKETPYKRNRKWRKYMLNVPIEIRYKRDYIPSGYSFSIKSNAIFLSEYFRSIVSERVRTAIQYVAIRAHYHYVAEVNRLKNLNEKINTFTVKRDSTEKAKSEACIKFSDVWDEVEKIYKEYEIKKPYHQSTTADSKIDGTSCTSNKRINLIIAMVDPHAFDELATHERVTFITDIKQLLQFL